MKLTKDLAFTAGGMAMLLTGRKLTALSMFGKGLYGLEQQWRSNHPDVPRTFSARWSEAIRFYESTHQDPTNRTLHRVGIPMIVGGAAALLVGRPMRPLWLLGWTSFTAGWVLNIVGHAKYEKKAPAFADDPLSFLAGPIWDLQQVRGERPKVVDFVAQAATTTALN